MLLLNVLCAARYIGEDSERQLAVNFICRRWSLFVSKHYLKVTIRVPYEFVMFLKMAALLHDVFATVASPQ